MSIRPIGELASSLGIDPDHVVLWGRGKAKLEPGARAGGQAQGKLILVSALTPTDAGEGKTTTSIGLAQGLTALGKKACLALREPSLGPVFGRKGGATGAGQAALVPAVDINLHFTGDFHAISAAHNLLAAVLDNHLQQGNRLGIDSRRVLLRRVVDLNDRALRNVNIGLGGPLEGVPRETGFDITPASEVMACLCLAEDAEDLRTRLSRILVALTREKHPVFAADLKVVGAMMALLKDALMPNLVQTVEGVPALVHGGPFANIAHGCNSVIATKTALALADWVVTEAGFGFDLGGEKFFDIKCVSAGLRPAAVVLVATLRALKRHGGVPKDRLDGVDPAAVERGLPNLQKHLENARAFGVPAVIALNRFTNDTDDEIDVVRRAAAAWGSPFAVSDHFARGGEGARALAEAVVAHATPEPGPVKPLYEASQSIEEKISTIARTIYGARDVLYTREAVRQLGEVRRLGGAHLPLCIAKTQMSFSDDPSRAGRPEGFDVSVRSVLLASGAGYVVPLMGDIVRMPGLPGVPQSEHVDLVDGKIVGVG